MKRPLIFMVEDDKDVADVNQRMLARRGYDTVIASNASDARAQFKTCEPDLIILDVMLPDGDGLGLCSEFRAKTDAPILFLTGRNDPSDMVLGIDTGGDTYMTKPYNYDEFLANVKALLRRAKKEREKVAERSVLTRGPLTVEILKSRALINGRNAQLTQKEFVILLTLIENEGRELSGEQLYEIVWGQSATNELTTVRMHVSRLRAKLGLDDIDEISISAKYGIGYCFSMDSEL
ncbi:MAG: response regulator transcription factor [Clostridiales Family XIII bacterium]|nr:response regulator transcription factor [Clostridiales Family XIII bacterium]